MLNSGFVSSLMQDLRYGLRGLRKALGFTLVATLTLALGIGACTAIFSIVSVVLLRPLTYKDSSRMVHIWTGSPSYPEFQLGQSIPNVNDLKALNHSLEATALYSPGRKTLTGNGEPEQLSAAAVTADFFNFFSVHPLAGREFVADDEQMKNGDVVVLSYGLWKRRFVADPKIVGLQITLDQKPYTVVGVLPEKFSYPEKTDLWVPLVVDAKEQAERQRWMYFMLGKVRAGVSMDAAQSELNGIAAGIGQQHPEEAAGIKFPIETLQHSAVGSGEAELLALTGAVGFLLLIACANVSNLVLSRGLKRQREIAVRAALGASRRRIMRQLLLEGLLLAFAGGLAGTVLASLGVAGFRALAPAGFPRLEELRIEPLTILIAFAITAFTGILCGLAPAASASRINLSVALKEKLATATARRFSLRGILAATEVALAFILLTGSALMVQSMVRLLKVDTGLRIDHVLSANLSLPKARYGTDDASRLFIRRLLDALRAQPQFSGVAISDNTILQGNTTLMNLEPDTLALLGINDQHLNLEPRTVTPGFFETLGIPVVRGRSFNDRDVKGATEVAIISESLARRFFPVQDPIGRTLKLGKDPTDQYQVIGEVADTLDSSLHSPKRLQIYFSSLQDADAARDSLNIVVRTTADPSASIGYLRSAVGSVDKDLPLTNVQTITQAISESVAEPRFRAWLLGAFAFAGLTLTLIGIYGVISYSAGQRTQEMGIRMALGAPQGNVLRLILREGLLLALGGAVVGLIGSFALMRLLGNQLYGVKPCDPATLAGAAVLMLAVALAASYFPARRATKVDPIVALRYE